MMHRPARTHTPLPIEALSREDIYSTCHRAVDRAVARAMSFRKVYSKGWGEPKRLRSVFSSISELRAPPPIDITWLDRDIRLDGTEVRDGYFPTPDQSLALPPASRTAYIQMVLPPERIEAAPPICIHLAGFGDSTLVGRRILALRLARQHGIGSIILENPYYGSRRPRGQVGTKLRTVEDQFLLNIAAVKESRSLLVWLRENGVESVGLTGYSMGGYMAAIAAQFSSFPLAVIPCATGHSVVYPIIHSPLRRMVDWPTLNRQLQHPYRASSSLARLFSVAAIPELGTLHEDSEAIMLANEYDEFILNEDVGRLRQHWNNCPLYWLKTGHTTGWALRGQKISLAIAKCFAKLDD